MSAACHFEHSALPAPKHGPRESEEYPQDIAIRGHVSTLSGRSRTTSILPIPLGLSAHSLVSLRRKFPDILCRSAASRSLRITPDGHHSTAFRFFWRCTAPLRP